MDLELCDSRRQYSLSGIWIVVFFESLKKLFSCELSTWTAVFTRTSIRFDKMTSHLATTLLLATLTGFTSYANASGNFEGRTGVSSSLVQERPTLAPDEGEVVDVPMCCPADHVFNISGLRCEPSDTRPPLLFHREDGQLADSPPRLQVTVGFPNCTYYSLHPDTDDADKFVLLPDGQLMMTDSKMKVYSDQFCLLASEHQMEAIVCFPEFAEDSSFYTTMVTKVYPIGMVISSLFLLLTLVVYCLVVELRDLLGRCLMCAVSSLCLAQVTTVIVTLGTNNVSMGACIFVAVLMHLCYTSAMFWLNVISFNTFLTVWWKNSASFGRRWFLVYSGYAWGVPGLISAVMLARDFHEGLQDSALPKPNFGLAKCWFASDDSTIVYFYGPISVVLGLNLILFCASAFKLCSLSKSSEARVFQFSLYLKLFVIMGVSWIFEVISFFVMREDRDSPAKYIWLFFDLINIMQGVLIFILMVCRQAVLVRVCEVLRGEVFSRKMFPKYYENQDEEPGTHEMKHSVI